MSKKSAREPGDGPRFQTDDLLADVVDRHPAAKDVLLSFGLPCFKCIVADRETLAEGCAPLLLQANEVLRKLNELPPHRDERPRSAPPPDRR